MSELEKYKQLLKSKGKKFSGVATDEEGYFHPDVSEQYVKSKMEGRVERKKQKKEEADVMSEGLDLAMRPIEKGEDIEARKKYSDIIMKRLKKMSPRT
jgi:hypothetical protein